MGRRRHHSARLEGLIVLALSGGDPPAAAAAVALANPSLDHTGQEALAAELAAIEAALPTLDAALAEALGSRGRRLETLAQPELAALRYGAWLLLGPQAMDTALAAKIAADLVDRYADANARPLVQGCLSRVASRRQPPTEPAAEPASKPPRK